MVLPASIEGSAACECNTLRTSGLRSSSFDSCFLFIILILHGVRLYLTISIDMPVKLTILLYLAARSSLEKYGVSAHRLALGAMVSNGVHESSSKSYHLHDEFFELLADATCSVRGERPSNWQQHHAILSSSPGSSNWCFCSPVSASPWLSSQATSECVTPA